MSRMVKSLLRALLRRASSLDRHEGDALARFAQQLANRLSARHVGPQRLGEMHRSLEVEVVYHLAEIRAVGLSKMWIVALSCPIVE